jgi:hypothetical protein
MASLSFSVIDARPEPYAAAPTLIFRLRIAESSGEAIHCILLRCQIRIEPRRRPYAPAEQEQLYELFGEPHRWGGTVKTLLWTHVSLLVPAFQGQTEIDLPVPCSYDLEVTGSKYFQALEDGDIPLLLLFSGSVFAKTENGFAVEQVPWDREVPFRLPVRVWRDTMDRYFPNSTWIRLRRESLQALRQFKGQRALPTWDDALAALLAEVKEPV